MLERRLGVREEASGQGKALVLEDVRRLVRVQFCEGHGAWVYTLDEDVEVPWRRDEEEKSPLHAGRPLTVLIRGRDLAGLLLGAERDIEAASNLPIEMARALLLPRDFERLPAEKQEDLKRNCTEKKVLLLVAPEPTTALDEVVVRRLATSRVSRQ